LLFNWIVKVYKVHTKNQIVIIIDYNKEYHKQMDYEEAISYISKFQFHGFKLGLERITKVLYALNSPHTRYPCIHVAGTNGKGSTCSMITSILSAYGLKVGLYTSPHLTYLGERFRIGLTPIDKHKLTKLISQIRKLIEEGFELSYFEFTTAIAFLYFAQEDVDVAVIEVGLGGRLDATNVINPEIGVITNIALDHMSFLGDSIEKIAYEKAGIIKSGMKIVNASKAEARHIIKKTCKQKGALFFDIKNFIKNILEKKQGGISCFSFDFLGLGYHIKDIAPPLLGKHQVENAALSTCASILFLENYGINIDPKLIKKGISSTRWPSRLEFLRKRGSGFVVLDGAHNKDGINKFLDFFTSFNHTYNKKILLMACSDEGGDKAFFEMFERLRRLFDVKIITQPPGPRRPVSIKRWEEKIDTKDICLKEDYNDALKEALSFMKEKDDLLVVTGSLYLAGAVRDKLINIGFKEYFVGS